MREIPYPRPSCAPRSDSDRPDFEKLLDVLCQRSAGDVHLDLAELDELDTYGVITLIRAAATLASGRHLVLHNPPDSVRRILAAVGPETGETGVLLA
jgi:anti-anti-sigma regulatory factor